MSQNCTFHISGTNVLVAFTAIVATNYSPGLQEKINYDNIITNVGGGYTSEKNEFVCDEPGTYLFYANVNPMDNTACHLYIARNGIEVSRLFGNSEATNTGSNMAILELDIGDAVAVYRGTSACTLYGALPYNTFAGFKIN